MSPTAPSDYRLSPALTARVVGAAIVGLALAVFVLTFVLAFAGLPGWLLLGVAAVGVGVVVGAALWATRGASAVHLDDDGYRVRFVRGVGVPAARWKEVKDVVTAQVQETPCVVVRLRDGRTSTIPMQALAGDPDEFVRDLRDRCQRGQGLRPLRHPPRSDSPPSADA